MATTLYKCPLAGEEVKVLVEHIIVFDERAPPKTGRSSPELRFCSHVGVGNCPVRGVEAGQSDVPGFAYAKTAECDYLKLLRHHD